MIGVPVFNLCFITLFPSDTARSYYFRRQWQILITQVPSPHADSLSSTCAKVFAQQHKDRSLSTTRCPSTATSAQVQHVIQYLFITQKIIFLILIFLNIVKIIIFITQIILFLIPRIFRAQIIIFFYIKTLNHYKNNNIITKIIIYLS